MRAGQKHVAIFFDYEPQGLHEILQEGYELDKFTQQLPNGTTYWTRIVYRSQSVEEARRLRDIVLEQSIGFSADREREIGNILSYSTKQIEYYISYVLNTSIVS